MIQSNELQNYISGIDLGTSNSCIAVIQPDGKPFVVPNERGENTTPSALYYDSDRYLVGKAAKSASYRDPTRYLVRWKQQMGEVGPDGKPIVLRFDEESNTEQTSITCSTHLLMHMKCQAETRLGTLIKHAVITVPAHFEDKHREATRQAGELAGFEVMRLVEEPVAAAISFGLNKQEDGIFVVYDLGGGTFDVTVVEIQQGVVHIRSKSGSVTLGVDDTCCDLKQNFLQRFEQKLGFPLDPVEDTIALHDLSETAEAVIKDLSELDSTTVRISGKGYIETFEFSRSEFEAIARPYVDQTMGYVGEALELAHIGPRDVHDVILVGGGTRIPLVRRTVTELFGKEPRRDVDPDTCVAQGAAVVAWEMSQRPTASAAVKAVGRQLPPAPFQTRDVTTYPLSVVVRSSNGHGYESHVMIEAGHHIPVTKTECFHPVEDYAPHVSVKVTQQVEATPFQDEHIMAQFNLEIPPLPVEQGGERIEVTYAINDSGIIEVSAKDLVSGNSVSGQATKIALSKERIDSERQAIQRKITP